MDDRPLKASAAAGHGGARTLRSFLTQLIWWCVLPLFVLAVALAAGHVRDVLDDQARDAERLVKNATAVVDQFLSARTGGLQVLAASPMADEPGSWPQLYAEARRFHASFGSQVVFVGLDRRLHFHTALAYPGPEPPELPALAGRSAFDAVLAQGHPAAGDLFDGPVEQQPMVAVAVPGLREGRVAFVMLSAIPAHAFEQQLASVTAPAGWSLALLDSTGRPIARQGAAPEGPVSRLAAGTQAAPWQVVLEVPRSDHLVPLVGAIAVMTLAVFGTTLAGVLGGEWASRRLTRSLRALTGSTASGGPAIEIAEVDTVRRLLDEAGAARDRAEAERQQTEARFRERLEQASVALQLREAQLRGIFDSATDGIVTIDEDQVIVMANPAAARMFGWSVDELVGSPLQRLLPERYREAHAEHVRRFGQGDGSARRAGTRPPLSGLRAGGQEFPLEVAISQLSVDGRRLYTAILRDVTERQRVEKELRDSKSRLEAALSELQASHVALQGLVGQHDRIQEAERKRIARELHDDLQQTLAAIMIDVTAIRAALPAPVAQAQPLLGRIEAMATSALLSTRRIVNDLRPQMLEELGLAAALDALATQFTQRTGVPCDFESEDLVPADERQAAPVMTCLYRVAQESLNNVAKHAKARYVQLELARRGNVAVVLRISDDGQGLAPQDRVKPQSFGLLGMAERTRSVGGTLQVISHPGDGTTVEVVVPLALRGESEPRSARQAGFVVAPPVGEAGAGPQAQGNADRKDEPGPVAADD